MFSITLLVVSCSFTVLCPKKGEKKDNGIEYIMRQLKKKIHNENFYGRTD